MRLIGWACSSAGEHYVDIVGVTGSIPVAPTIFEALKTQCFQGFLLSEGFRRIGPETGVVLKLVLKQRNMAR